MNNDHISKFDTTKSCDVQYSPDEIEIILSHVTKQPLDLAVFHTGYLNNVLENFVTSFLC